MALFKDSRPSLPTSAEAVENLTYRDTVMMVMVGSALLTLILPALYILLVPASLGYYLWASKQKYRLPFKTPITFFGPDHGNSTLVKKGYLPKGTGILFIDIEEKGRGEIWIEPRGQ